MMPRPEEHPDPDAVPGELETFAREGDREAAGRLLESHRSDLERFCYRYLGNVHEAEDATQDVMAAILGTGRWPQRGLRAFLYRTARNRCIDICRRRRGGCRDFVTFHTDEPLHEARAGPPTAAVRGEDREVVRRHLRELPQAQAEVLMLRYFENLPRKEIGAVLDLPESVVKSRLYEGMKKLYGFLEGDLS